MPRDIEKALRGCFHPKEGKPNLRKVPADTARAHQHIDKAHRNLRAMKMMFDNDLFDWAIICGYYAMYHAVLAALFAQIGRIDEAKKEVEIVVKLDPSAKAEADQFLKMLNKK